MSRSGIQIRNRAANAFLNAADAPGIDKEIRSRLREIGNEILNSRSFPMSREAEEELLWLGRTIHDYMDLGNLNIIENYAEAVSKILSAQKGIQKGEGKMSFLGKIFQKKNESERKEEQIISKRIFELNNLIEKYTQLIRQEEAKAKEYVTAAASQDAGSPEYNMLQMKWGLSQDSIRSYNTNLVRAMQTMQINMKLSNAMDIYKTAQLLETLMPDSQKTEKLINKAIDKSADLADMQEEMNILLDDAISEINGSVTAPVNSREFSKEVTRLKAGTEHSQSADPAAGKEAEKDTNTKETKKEKPSEPAEIRQDSSFAANED